MGSSSSVPVAEPPLTYFEREIKTLHDELVKQRERDHFTKEEAKTLADRLHALAKVADAVVAKKEEEEAAAATAAVEVSTPRAPSDASTVKSEPAPPPPSDGEAEAAELRAAVAAASTAEPLPPAAGEVAETWDGGETFHWSSRPKGADGALLKIDAASERFKVEKRAFAAIVALDKAAHRMHTRPKCSASYRAVRVGWLKSFAATLDRAWATFEVVAKKVQHETAATRCRFVELLAAGDVGEADLFASHTWGALFVDLVAAIAHVATDDMFVWIDIFAVRQWPGNVGDLDFRPVVGEARAFLLSARHIDEVAQMSDADVLAHKVPEVAKRVCAFCRVWCVVELGSAVAFEKPVVMLVGAASADGSSFEPNGAMLVNLYVMTDVRKAVASVEADRVRELANVEAQEGGADAVNSLARGACMGAGSCMARRDILAAAVGNLAALDELESKEAREEAMRCAAAGGYADVVRALLDKGADVNAADKDGDTALSCARMGEHEEVAKFLEERMASGA